MAKEGKKQVRQHFRDVVFGRDHYHCLLCPDDRVHPVEDLDAHHITDRHLMPQGGYVLENGVTVCPQHHLEVEAGHPTPDELYGLIGSSHRQALVASERL